MNYLAYPRLPDSAALVRLHEMRTMAEDDPKRLQELVAVDHPLAQPVPTGASLATSDQILSVRESVTDALAHWLTGTEVPRGQALDFEVTLGRVLHESLRIMPADAGHDETWSFLAAVVFPDVVWARFPNLHQDRVLGKPRNVLRRAWHRHDVIGDLQEAAEKPLGEDELTAIFERTAVASNRRLARVMAKAILASNETNRSEFARKMAKQVTKMTGPLLLDVLNDAELHELVTLSSEGRTWPGPPDLSTEPESQGQGVDAGSGTALAGASEAAVEAPTIPRAKATGDLVRQFHKDMVALALESQPVLGYRPSVLLGLVDDLGGVEAARRIVGTDHASDSFTTLWERQRLDLTVEYLVLDAAYAGLFGPELLERASWRLREHGMALPDSTWQ